MLQVVLGLSHLRANTSSGEYLRAGIRNSHLGNARLINHMLPVDIMDISDEDQRILNRSAPVTYWVLIAIIFLTYPTGRAIVYHRSITLDIPLLYYSNRSGVSNSLMKTPVRPFVVGYSSIS